MTNIKEVLEFDVAYASVVFSRMFIALVLAGGISREWISLKWAMRNRPDNSILQDRKVLRRVYAQKHKRNTSENCLPISLLVF